MSWIWFFPFLWGNKLDCWTQGFVWTERFGHDNWTFLAPTEAQGVTICVCPFGSSLSRAVNLDHSGSNIQAISQE